MFVLEEGTVEVQTPDGRAWELGPGEFFGELALLTDHPRNARIRAKTPVRCLAISRMDFQKLLKEEPEIAVAMLPKLAAADRRAPLIAGLAHNRTDVRVSCLPMDQLFEIARKTFDTPEFRGITFIESEAKSIINRVPGGALPFDWTINPYRGCCHACVYCFARPTHTYLDMNAGRDFETKIVVKVNAPDVLRRELAAKRWKGEHIAMGTEHRPVSARGGPVQADARDHRGADRLSEPVLDPHEGHADPSRPRPPAAGGRGGARSRRRSRSARWTTRSGGRPSPARLIRGRGSKRSATLTEAGIPTGVLMAPILPGISDRPEQLREVVGARDRRGSDPRLADPAAPAAGRSRGVPARGWRKSTRTSSTRYLQMYRQPYGPKAMRAVFGRQVSSMVAAAGGVRRGVEPARRFFRRDRAPHARSRASEQLRLL